VIGAVAGGLFVGVVPAAVLKLVLGVILIVSAVRIFRGHQLQLPRIVNRRSSQN
jgi:uncharacterized membrane protein YfcA